MGKPKKNSGKRPPPRRRPWGKPLTTAEKRRLVPQVFVLEDRLHALQKAHGIQPTRVCHILISPYGQLSVARDLSRVRAESDRIRRDLRPAKGEARAGLEEEIALLEKEETRLLEQLGAASLAGGKKWSLPPSGVFWLSAPVAIPGERWMNPRQWGWLRERAAKLAEYLSHTRLVTAKRPWKDHAAEDAGKKGMGVYSLEVRAERPSFSTGSTSPNSTSRPRTSRPRSSTTPRSTPRRKSFALAAASAR